MNVEFLMILLAFGTLGLFAVLFFRSKRATEKRMDDPDAPKSTLAADAPSTRSQQ